MNHHGEAGLPGPAGAWPSFVAAFLATALAVSLLLTAMVVATDPYDTGRFALLSPRKREAISPRLDMASRGRDPSTLR